MLNFIMGRKIEVLLENTIQNNISCYKEMVKNLIYKYPDGNVPEEKFVEIHDALIQNIVVDVTNFMKGNPFSIFTKYQMYMMTPSIVENFFQGEKMSMAILYCIVYYALTGKKASSVKATKQNHVLHAYKTQVHNELDNELSEKN